MKHFFSFILLAFALVAPGCKSDPAPGPETKPEPESELVAEDDNFRIEASNVTASTVDVLVTPKDKRCAIGPVITVNPM